MKLANHNNGLCAIKKVIIHCTNPVLLQKILVLIINNLMNLIQNPYGNYSIQVALDVILLIYLELERGVNFSYYKAARGKIRKFI